MTDKPVAYFLAKILLSMLLLCGSSVIQAKAELVLSGCPQETIALTPFFQIVHDNTGLMQRDDIEQLAASRFSMVASTARGIDAAAVQFSLLVSFDD